MNIPKEIQRAYLFWILAIASGMAETIFVVTDSLLKHSTSIQSLFMGILVRGVIYTIFILVTIQMRKQKNWARIVLAIGLGIVGTLSLIMDPITWLMEGHAISEAFVGMDVLTVLFTLSRIIHILCVFIALFWMFQPNANQYFRSSGKKDSHHAI
ncbi:hypothetical protein [Shimazuella kribbensis]|uniref:hypothetical protein n=1 Tax=Shimazuella kribbensis TaxID=139808 RepID=UPI00041BB00C|nr:hypothetical protein [Shimazuella kribbensis]